MQGENTENQSHVMDSPSKYSSLMQTESPVQVSHFSAPIQLRMGYSMYQIIIKQRKTKTTEGKEKAAGINFHPSYLGINLQLVKYKTN